MRSKFRRRKVCSAEHVLEELGIFVDVEAGKAILPMEETHEITNLLFFVTEASKIVRAKGLGLGVDRANGNGLGVDR